MRPGKVSIVLPTHNGMPLFARVLDGILAQRCSFPFELYCVDTASTDGTWKSSSGATCGASASRSPSSTTAARATRRSPRPTAT
jgi:hypothetical protein